MLPKPPNCKHDWSSSSLEVLSPPPKQLSHHSAHKHPTYSQSIPIPFPFSLSALSGSSSPSFSSSSHFSRNALFSLSPSHLPLFSRLFYSLKSPAIGHECNKFNPINFHLCQSYVRLYSMAPSCVYLSKHKNLTTRLQSVVPSLALPPASSPISAQYIHSVFPSGFSCQFSFNISLKYNGYFTACFLAIAGEEILGHKFCQISQNSSQSYCLRVWKY